jgi:hypothetical protein
MPTRPSTQGSATGSVQGSVAAPTVAPQYTGPTEAITAVANAITVEHKSLDILVSVAPLLTRRETVDVVPGGPLYPVTISIAFISTVGAERQTQAYSALVGNRFVHADLEAEGQPRSVHLDITLTQPNPKGGEYSYNIPLDVELDPLYDVAVYPLEFTLLNSSAIIGSTTIVLYFAPPDGGGSWTSTQFDTNPDQVYSVAAFKWERLAASASDGLLTPALAYYVTADYPGAAGFQPGWIPEGQVALIPGKTHVVEGGLQAILDETIIGITGNVSSAYYQYAITYALCGYFGEPDQA